MAISRLLTGDIGSYQERLINKLASATMLEPTVKCETEKRNGLILLVGGLIAVNCSWRFSDYWHESIEVLVFVVGAFMIIAGGLIHIKLISRLEKEIAELQKRNDTQPNERSNGEIG